MKNISNDTKVCESCRGAYYSWKRSSSEFGDLFSKIELEMSDDIDSDTEVSAKKENEWFIVFLSFLYSYRMNQR